MINIIFFVVLGLIAIIGLIQGFSGGLKFYLKGFFGLIITIALSVFLCGVLRKIDAINDWVITMNGSFIKFASFLNKWAADLVFFIIVCVAVGLVKWLLTKILIKLFTIDNLFVKFINKLFGLIFAVGMALIFAWIICYIIGMFKDGEVLQSMYNFLESKGGNILVKLLQWNPIIN